MQFIYTLSIYLLHTVYRLAALFHPKARQWVQGRRHWHQQLQDALQEWPVDAPRLWMHCASLGEFEQGRPVLEAVRSRYPHYRILLTFFSPSGYELRRNYQGADHVCYLPADQPAAARTFVHLTRPDLVVFVKYEFWYNHLQEIQRQQIPLVLISALFRPQQVFFQPYGKWFARILGKFDLIFTQDEHSRQLLQRLSIPAVTAGDTRVDRVLRIAGEATDVPSIARWVQSERVLIAGSTWPPDEVILQAWWEAQGQDNPWQLIIAPHDISEKHLSRIQALFASDTVHRYTTLPSDSTAPILLVDTIGMLASIYRYGQIAYIGGGFGAGIHNTLEPMAFGLPVLFGPRYEKFTEARALVATGGGFAIQEAEDMSRILRQLQDPYAYRPARKAVQEYLGNNRGATQVIVQRLQNERLLNPMP